MNRDPPVGLPHSRELKWYREARLGILICFGPSSAVEATTDADWWHKTESAVSTDAFDAFAPEPKVTGAWARLAKHAGARYVTVTAKHHDGFCLWPSEFTDWCVRAERDLLRVLAESCREEGLRLFVYYSLIDWHEPTYADDWPAYLDFMERQLQELLTGYGSLGGIWLDGAWARPLSDWQLGRLYAAIHRLQPQTLIGNNHHVPPLAGEDYQIYESAFPDEVQLTGGIVPRADMPGEVAMKLGPTWFHGNNGFSPERSQVDDLLDGAAKRDINLLLNVPPRGDGSVDDAYWTAVEDAVL